jgi:hypothetical protein
VLDFVLFALALSLALAVLALSREVRLRRALQRLLHFLLSRWRIHESTDRNRSAANTDDERLR